MDTSEAGPRSVVVGCDGSAGAARAVRWAALEAARRSAPLRIVHAWSLPVLAYSATIGAAYIDPLLLKEGAQQVADEAAAAIVAELGDDAPVIEAVTVEAGPAYGLVESAREAAMLVVGTRGRGGLARLVLGSVATTCAHHSAVPLVMVGDEALDPGTGELVVGMDDSAGARCALRWAAEEATLLGVAVRVVHGWEVPTSQPAGSPSVVDPIQPATYEVALRRTFEEIIEAEVGPGTAALTIASETDSPAEMLVEEAKDAALLILGSRGRGGFAGLLLGSVSQKCLHLSHGALVIVPTDRTVPDAAG